VKYVERSVVDHLDGGRGGAVGLCSLLEMGDSQVWSVCSACIWLDGVDYQREAWQRGDKGPLQGGHPRNTLARH